jgi:hypothetical protein
MAITEHETTNHLDPARRIFTAECTSDGSVEETSERNRSLIAGIRISLIPSPMTASSGSTFHVGRTKARIANDSQGKSHTDDESTLLVSELKFYPP